MDRHDHASPAGCTSAGVFHVQIAGSRVDITENGSRVCGDDGLDSACEGHGRNENLVTRGQFESLQCNVQSRCSRTDRYDVFHTEKFAKSVFESLCECTFAQPTCSKHVGHRRQFRGA